MTNPSKRLIAVLAIGLGLTVTAAPAFAEIPQGPGDLTTCVDLDEQGQPECDYPDDDLPEQQPEPEVEEETPEVDDSSDTAPVDDAIVATPNFTG